MNTNYWLMQLGSIEVMVVRKDIKNLHLSVLPPDGKVRVSSPIAMQDDAIRTLIATRIPWIRRQKEKFEAQERQTPRAYVSGESHYFLGKRYRLELLHVNQPPTVSLQNKNKILLQVRPESSVLKREKVMMEWYRRQLRGVSEQLLVTWQKKVGVSPQLFGIKRMKTRWGTCNQKAGRISINLELAKKSTEHIEYVLVHELVHLIERKHNDRFTDLMTDYLSKWRSTREELNRMILSHEKWNY